MSAGARLGALVLPAILAWGAGRPEPVLGQPSGRTFEADTAASRIWVVTHRAGLLGFLGHEHAMVPGAWSARVCAEPGVWAGATGRVRIATASLRVDTEAARALAGLGEGPGEDDRREIRARLLDPDHLAADAHPGVEIDLDGVRPDGGGTLAARARVVIRGRVRDYPLAIRHEAGPGDGVRWSGRLRIRQRDFGIDPESVAGVVRVADEVDLHFDLTARPTGGTCEP